MNSRRFEIHSFSRPYWAAAGWQNRFRIFFFQEQPEFSQRQDDPERVAPSESVPVFLPFPGADHTPSSPPSNNLGKLVLMFVEMFGVVVVLEVVEVGVSVGGYISNYSQLTSLESKSSKTMIYQL